MSEKQPHNTDERRQFYRNKNSVFVKIELLDSLELETSEKNLTNQTLETTYLLKTLGNLITQNSNFYKALEPENQACVQHLESLNRQLVDMVDYVNTTFDLKFSELQEVDLSGGGIRFESEQELIINQLLRMEIVLVPDYDSLSVTGVVVDCKPCKDKSSFDLAVNFSEISEYDRDIIIKHVFKSQSEQLRSQKQTND
jgi:hypothetical protein